MAVLLAQAEPSYRGHGYAVPAGANRQQPQPGRCSRLSPHSWRSELLAAIETPLAEPGEEEYPGRQHDPADPEHPQDGGVRADERVD
jgi:hypothetical protein